MIDFFLRNIPLALVIFLSFLSITVFLYRLKYLKPSQIRLWGIYLILDFILTVGTLFISFELNVNFLPYANLFQIVMQIIQFGIILTLLSYKNIAKLSILYLVFGVYFLIWLVEFSSQIPIIQKDGFQAIRYLKVAPVFICMTVIVGVLLYWTDIYKEKELGYIKKPFFWLTLGWFIYFSLTSIGYFYDNYDVAASNNPLLKKVHELINVQFQITDMVAYVCYIIAFWKTKNWAKFFV